MSASVSNQSSSRSPTDIVMSRKSRAGRGGSKPAARPASRSSSKHVARAAWSRAPAAGAASSAAGSGDALSISASKRRHRVGVLARDARELTRRRPASSLWKQDRACRRRRRSRTAGRAGSGRSRSARSSRSATTFGLQHRDDVGRARDALAGPQLLGHARAAEQVAALEHAHAQAGAREVGGGGQAVVAAADDDRVELAVAVAVAVASCPPPRRAPPGSGRRPSRRSRARRPPASCSGPARTRASAMPRWVSSHTCQSSRLTWSQKLDRVGRVEARRAAIVARLEEPLADDLGAVGRARPQRVQHHVVRVQRDQRVREQQEVEDRAQVVLDQPSIGGAWPWPPSTAIVSTPSRERHRAAAPRAGAARSSRRDR